jgi:hypothetical protein
MSRQDSPVWPYDRLVADVPPSEIRIGDSERETAMSALGEHMSSGRLDVDEYGDRVARVTAAKTRGELTALFTDLPAPHPVFGQIRRPEITPVPPAAAPVPAPSGPPLAQRVMAAAVPLAGIVALVLFFTFGHMWQFFLIPAAVTVLGGALLNDGGRRNRDQYRRYRRRGRW